MKNIILLLLKYAGFVFGFATVMILDINDIELKSLVNKNWGTGVIILGSLIVSMILKTRLEKHLERN